MKPEEALPAARAAAAGRHDELPPGVAIEPTERVSIEQLMEWAAIEPDVELMVSTRRLGAPITWFKRKLIFFMRQYLRELQSQQTRFNLNVLIRVAEMEDRVTRLEEASAAGADPRSPGGSQGAGTRSPGGSQGAGTRSPGGSQGAGTRSPGGSQGAGGVEQA
jgi:uncharacterized membrane protein YgcG